MSIVLQPLKTKTITNTKSSCRFTNPHHPNRNQWKLDDDRYQEEKINVFFRFIDGITFCLLIHPFLEDIESISKRLLVARNQQQQHKQQHDIMNTRYPLSSFRVPITTNDLVLMWNGKPIDGNDTTTTLADYNLVKDGAHTIHVSTRQKGGCFMVSFTILIIIFTALVGSTCTCGLSLLIIPILMPLLFVLPLFCL